MMILKEEGNVKIHRLQVIQLYEADLNFILGLRWKEAVYQAVNTNTIHPGQYGGRPGRDPITITLIEELHLDHSQLTRTPFTNLDNDCTSNFDRILMPLASLVACGFGIHRQVIFVHANTLENAIFKLKISNQVTGDEAYRQCVNFLSMAPGKAAAIHPSSGASSPANCLPAMTGNVMG
eukprot:CAMPEP_0201252400 /NCGR_PEP_ID=MMETSP0852-20130820/66895_1 /ASSEMBLY_ACC=CAM_ASM_000632 /TAXON_ID=183588 /ORGANISM="Pseudo-nitzschia fraudulenta, Strain WWA7" /LENGTH=178 /DNA_ID=CAMNT_0047552111 /DNA_START=1112 /DNA_END=1648 /DNA_ORIENTATION=-